MTREEARERGRKGAAALHAKRRAAREPRAPYTGSMLDAMNDVGMIGPSWSAWRTFWRVASGVPLSDVDMATFTACTGRTRVPAGPLRELALVIGRRGGKSRNLALLALYTAVKQDYAALLAEGERAIVAVVAADRKQAAQVLRFLRGMSHRPAFAPYLKRSLRDAVEFTTLCDVQVMTASHATVRGYSLAAVLADEVSFWNTDEAGASPDSEVLAALRPGLANVPRALLVCASTPYSARGELFRAWERSFAREDQEEALCWVAPSLTMNPTLDPAVIERAYQDDPVAAASEYGAEWRRDVEGFLDAEAVRAVTVSGRRELPPMEGVRYVAFVDPSGGSQDAFTLAIAHQQEGRAVLDLVRERRPPFSPEDVVTDFAATLASYRIAEVTGDRYAGEWPRERFQVHGVRYVPSERVKSTLYTELLPLVNAGRCELLDVPRLTAQFAALERRVARGGKDSVDHAPGAHDDVANAAAGALVLAGTQLEDPRTIPWFPGMKEAGRGTVEPLWRPFTPRPEAGRSP
jgi:hypothetical protein